MKTTSIGECSAVLSVAIAAIHDEKSSVEMCLL